MTKQPYREKLRTEVLAIARQMLETEGLSALHARRIAQSAGCSVGSLYNVFGDLDGLIIAVNMQTVADLRKALTASDLGSAALKLDERLADLAITYARFAVANAYRWRALFEHTLTGDRTIPETYRNDQAQLLSLIEKNIASEISDTAMRVRAGRALFAAVHGIVLLAIDSKLAPFDPQAMELEIRFIVKAAAHGLGAAV
ncbi:MAG: TetR/AcrR family transcriptional regulator [Hyphomicrobium sp.]